jgi:hypothetical protein
MRQFNRVSITMDLLKPIFNPPEADKGLIPRPLGRINITDGYPVACSGVVHWEKLSISIFHE